MNGRSGTGRLDRCGDALAEALAALRANDGVVGEEGAARDSATGRTWVIDPVDGQRHTSRLQEGFLTVAQNRVVIAAKSSSDAEKERSAA